MAEFPTMDEINASADPAPEPTAPAAAEPTAPAAAEPTAPAGHPWDADLAGLQLAPEHSKAVSDYLAAQWQPRMTQYEQDLKTWRDAFGGNEEHRDLGAKIIKNFTNDPFISKAVFDKAVDRQHGYPVPYRTFYSTNIGNLFMAGRCISVTHEALGTVRVMKTGSDQKGAVADEDGDEGGKMRGRKMGRGRRRNRPLGGEE